MCPTETYTCSVCKFTFNKINTNDWNEELAKKEYKQNFPNSRWEDREVVCDDCWQLVKPDKPVFIE